MRIALAHLRLSVGGEHENFLKLQQAVDRAASADAEWLLTPETALQGYHFHKVNPREQPAPQPDVYAAKLAKQAGAAGMALFLGCAEYDKAGGSSYNSCLVFDRSGRLAGRHRKVVSYTTGAEAWSAQSAGFSAVACGGIKAGVMVCADAWYEENARTLADDGAQILLGIAAWPYGPCRGDPVQAWARCSKAAQLPMLVCNQTGNNPYMDLSRAESAILDKGRVLDRYCGPEAVLLSDWSPAQGTFSDSFFSVLKL